jgi:hypothetical protein
MSHIKRIFYMLLGFSFPFYWMFHATGFADIFYKPIQLVASTESTIWPSFITASLMYVGLVVLIERLYGRRENFNPELHNLHQQPLFDHESFLQDHYKEKELDPQHPQESSADQEESAPKTDQ